MKFSEVWASVKTKDEALAEARLNVATIQADDDATRSTAVAALHAKDDKQVALPQPDGSVLLLSLSADGSSIVTTTVSGDFDVPDASPAPTPTPATPEF